MDKRKLTDTFKLEGTQVIVKLPDDAPSNPQSAGEAALATNAQLMNAGYIPRRGKCIENQALWGKAQFGNSPNSNMSYSGCEIIATYNALSALGEPTSADTMVSLISRYDGFNR